MKEQSAWYYVSRVTISEAWRELKANLLVSLFLALFIPLLWAIPYALVTLLGIKASSSESRLDQFIRSIPWWIIAPTLMSAIFWFMRGQKIQFPRLDFKLWLIIAIVQFAVFAGFAFLPWWIAVPAYYVISSPLLFLDRLIDIGRDKAQKEIESTRTDDEN